MTGKNTCLEKKKAPLWEPKMCTKKLPERTRQFLVEYYGTQRRSLLAESCGEKTGQNVSCVLRKSVRSFALVVMRRLFAPLEQRETIIK